MTGVGFAKRTEGALPRLARVTVAVAMAGLLALAGCATEEEPVGVEAPVPEAVEEAPEQDAAGAPVEPEQEAQAPEPESVVSALESYTWDELSQISAEIAAAGDEDAAIEVAKQYELCAADGRLDGTQIKSVTLNDGTKTSVQIVGFAHDDKTNGGKAGITFIFNDAIAQRSMNEFDTNVGGWESSKMRAWLASSAMGILPSDLAGNIVAVDKLTNNSGDYRTKVSAVTATSDLLWLFSDVELKGELSGDSSHNPIRNAEGSQYKLYRDYGVQRGEGTEVLARNFAGEPEYWWLRSPYTYDAEHFTYLTPTGFGPNENMATEIEGVVPGFCI